jgi:hypothetical protein
LTPVVSSYSADCPLHPPSVIESETLPHHRSFNQAVSTTRSATVVNASQPGATAMPGRTVLYHPQ